MIGKTISHYRITSKLGEGGMGAVYLAEDQRLDRTVAVKFLPPDIVGDPGSLERFRREAKSAARLKHPNIVTIYEFDEHEKSPFLVMEYVEGETLRQMIGKGKIPVRTAVDVALQVCEGLAKAHEAGITHRDIKPENIVIDAEGRARILDFGVAKLEGHTAITTEEKTVGTFSYMSPEQALGKSVDHRSDIFSLGAVVYEILVGEPPFGTGPLAAVVYRIVHEEQDPLPPELRHFEDVLSRALAKEPDSRFQSVEEFVRALRGVVDESSRAALGRRAGGENIVRWVVAVVVLASLAAIFFLRERTERRWDDASSLALIERLIGENRIQEAFELASGAPREDLVPDRHWQRISKAVTIHTEPPGARVSMRPWDGEGAKWSGMGETPIDDVLVAAAVNLWRIEKPGYPPLEFAYDGNPREMTLRLVRDSTMVSVPGGRMSLKFITGLVSTQPVDLDEFLIGRREITNREYFEFVKAGGYKRDELWEHPFLEEGRELGFEEAMKRFVDVTGRPGPSTWQLGRFPQGQDEYPVTGVSWFEAAAYAKFAGKHLPTIFHWNRAAGRNMASILASAGNFGSEGPRAVTSSRLPGAYGIFDMAGNVREWCLNSSQESRFILGGGWQDPSYMFTMADHRSPFDRSASNGIRCVDYAPSPGPVPEASVAISLELRDPNAIEPASDQEFDQIKRMYRYSPAELDAISETVGESPTWLRERVEYSAGYDDERMFGWLFLPKVSRPPYQLVILFPGANAFDSPSSATVNDLTSWDAVDFVVDEGRAVLCPVFALTYERRGPKTAREMTSLEYRDATERWVRELRQSMLYLESRGDIDMERVALYGSSFGAMLSPLLLALVPQFRTAILRHGGIWIGTKPSMPEYNGENFAPRVKIPVLMMNGRYDVIYPVEGSQRLLFDLLGTPADDKRHVLFDIGHDYPPRNEMIRLTLDWLDEYMGEVE